MLKYLTSKYSIALFGLIFISGGSVFALNQTQTTGIHQVTPMATPVQSSATPLPTPEVQPIKTTAESPSAAVSTLTPSALCFDGTFSFSAHRSGTCSHHGGVDVWIGLAATSDTNATSTAPIGVSYVAPAPVIPSCNQGMKTVYQNSYQSLVDTADQLLQQTIANNEYQASLHGLSGSGLVANENAMAKTDHDQRVAGYNAQLTSNLASINCI